MQKKEVNKRGDFRLPRLRRSYRVTGRVKSSTSNKLTPLPWKWLSAAPRRARQIPELAGCFRCVPRALRLGAGLGTKCSPSAELRGNETVRLLSQFLFPEVKKEKKVCLLSREPHAQLIPALFETREKFTHRWQRPSASSA